MSKSDRVLEDRILEWRFLSDAQLVPILQATGKWSKKRVKSTLFYALSMAYVDEFARFLRLYPRSGALLDPAVLEKFADVAYAKLQDLRDCVQAWQVLKRCGWEGYQDPEWLIGIIETDQRMFTLNRQFALLTWLLEEGCRPNTPLKFPGSIQRPDRYMLSLSPWPTRVLDRAIFSPDAPRRFIHILLRWGARFGQLNLNTDMFSQPPRVRDKYAYARRVFMRLGFLYVSKPNNYPLPEALMRLVCEMF